MTEKYPNEATLVSYIRANNIVGLTDYLQRENYDINKKDESNHGFTPLMVASARGFTEITLLLLKNGADIGSQSQRGWTAIMIAARQGHAETVSRLWLYPFGLDVAHLDLDEQDFDGRTALFHAVIGTHPKCAVTLLNCGADPNWQAHDGSTPIIFAASKGDLSMIELLLDYSADRYLTMDDGRSATTIAETRGHDKAARRLRQTYPASLNFDDVHSYSINAKLHQQDWKRNWPHHCKKCFGNGMDGKEECVCLAKGFCPRCDDSGWKYGTALPLSIPCRHCGWLFDDQMPPAPMFILTSDGIFIDDFEKPNGRDLYKLQWWQKFSDKGEIEWATNERPSYPQENIVRPIYKCRECKFIGHDLPDVLKKCEDCHMTVAIRAIDTDGIDHMYCDHCGGFPETICDKVCRRCQASLPMP